MLRLFGEPEANARAFAALARFLDLLDDDARPADGAARARSARALVPAQAALALGLPAARHRVRRVRRGERARRLLGARRRRRLRRARAGLVRALARGAGRDRAAALDAARGRRRRRARRPRAPRGARRGHLLLRGARGLPAADALGVKRELGDGFELDDDPARIDVAAVHRFISEESYWAPGRAYERAGAARARGLPGRRPLPRRAARSASAARSRPYGCRSSTSRTCTS